MTRRQFRGYVLSALGAAVFGAVVWVIVLRPAPLETALDLICMPGAVALVVLLAIAGAPKEWRKEMIAKTK